uniref:Si:dkey-201c13.2 n=1 Tax=Lepisosteus oculatus TaxID=7918 RepID=W5NLW7_LEPOC
LLDLAGGRGSGLAAHASGVDRFRRDEVKVLVIRDLVQPVAIFQQLDVQVLVDLLQRKRDRL